MNAEEHWPAPWRKGEPNEQGTFIVYAANDKWVDLPFFDEPEDNALADFIIAAVNGRAALIEEADEARRALDDVKQERDESLASAQVVLDGRTEEVIAANARRAAAERERDEATGLLRRLTNEHACSGKACYAARTFLEKGNNNGRHPNHRTV